MWGMNDQCFSGQKLWSHVWSANLGLISIFHSVMTIGHVMLVTTFKCKDCKHRLWQEQIMAGARRASCLTLSKKLKLHPLKYIISHESYLKLHFKLCQIKKSKTIKALCGSHYDQILPEILGIVGTFGIYTSSTWYSLFLNKFWQQNMRLFYFDCPVTTVMELERLTEVTCFWVWPKIFTKSPLERRSTSGLGCQLS